jgi:hypothetical protein
MGEITMPTESEIKGVMVAYLLDRRSALCRELASVERQLERLGQPVRNPKMPTEILKPLSKSDT